MRGWGRVERRLAALGWGNREALLRRGDPAGWVSDELEAILCTRCTPPPPGAARRHGRHLLLPTGAPAAPCALSLRDYGAPVGVVREDNVADIRPPTSSAADIRVSNSIPAPNLHLLHGVPRLSLSVRLVRRLGALPIHSKLLSKVYPVLEHPCVFNS